jgi:hypothetical protein
MKTSHRHLEQTLEFARRHRNISSIFYKHCEKIRGIIEEMQINYDGLSDERKNAHWFYHGICRHQRPFSILPLSKILISRT